MKIAFPVEGKKGLEEELSPHFGRCRYYFVYDTEEEKGELQDNTSQHRGGKGYPPELIKKYDADIMITTGVGRNAIQMFNDIGIKVYCGFSGSVREALKQYEEGNLCLASPGDGCEGDHKH